MMEIVITNSAVLGVGLLTDNAYRLLYDES